MYLRWGTVLQIILKKAGAGKDAIRSLKPNDAALRERKGRPNFGWAILLTEFIASWWDQCQQMGWNFVMVTSCRVMGLCWCERVKGIDGGDHWEEQAIVYSAILGWWRRGKTKQEQQPRCNTTSNVCALGVWLAQFITPRTVIHKSLSPGTCSAHASHPSSSSCVVRENSKSCSKEWHISGFCLSSLTYGKASVTAMPSQLKQLEAFNGENHKEWSWRKGGCPACGSLSKNKSHWNATGKHPSATYTGMPL